MTSGDWCPSYLQRLENKYLKGKMPEEKYNTAKQFIINKAKSINELQETYSKMTEEEKRAYRQGRNWIFSKMKCASIS